jgi:hypothetical protein
VKIVVSLIAGEIGSDDEMMGVFRLERCYQSSLKKKRK